MLPSCKLPDRKKQTNKQTNKQKTKQKTKKNKQTNKKKCYNMGAVKKSQEFNTTGKNSDHQSTASECNYVHRADK